MSPLLRNTASFRQSRNGSTNIIFKLWELRRSLLLESSTLLGAFSRAVFRSFDIGLRKRRKSPLC